MIQKLLKKHSQIEERDRGISTQRHTLTRFRSVCRQHPGTCCPSTTLVYRLNRPSLSLFLSLSLSLVCVC